MSHLYSLRVLLNYAEMLIPLVVIAMSFTLPSLKRARFVLYPLWYYLAIPIAFLVRLIPGAGGGLVTPGDPIHLFEVTGILGRIAALVIAYLALNLYLSRTRSGRVKTFDDIVFFIALVALSLAQITSSLRYTDTFSVIHGLTSSILPIVFLLLAWKNAGHLAPSVPDNLGSLLRVPRFILSLGVILKLIAMVFPKILFIITRSGHALFGAGFLALYASMLGTLVLFIGFASYERLRYKFSNREAVS